MSDNAKKYVDLSLRQVDRGLRFVDNLLNIKRLKSGEVKLDISSFNFSELVNQIVNDYRFNLEQGNLKLQVFGCAAKCDRALRADKEKLGQVVSNILNNSIKHTPEGGFIKIDAVMDENMLKVSISDTGDGIAAEKQAKIFDYYEQVNPSDKETGMGLGLAISKYICELHGGRIWLESELGKGSTFNFTIPNKQDLCADKKTVLIVDDMADERLFARYALENGGFCVEEAGKGEEAISKIHSRKIDVVLLDIQMPGMSGIELLKLIRNEKDASSLPVIMYSAQLFDTELFIKLGANSCLSKSAGLEVLVGEIKKVLFS